MTEGIDSKTGSTLIVVEDDVLIRLSIAAYLRDCGYRVLEAASGDEALTVLADSGIMIDVILSDAEMRGVH